MLLVCGLGTVDAGCAALEDDAEGLVEVELGSDSTKDSFADRQAHEIVGAGEAVPAGCGKSGWT